MIDLRISLVIATYNRSRLLMECLDSLKRQRFHAGDEVVVADNGSTDDTQQVLRQAAADLPVPLICISESRPGKSHAVARAAAACSGELIALTDDDVRVADDWFDRIRAVFGGPGVDLACGRVLPRFERRVPGWLDLSGKVGFGRLAAPLGLADYGPAPEPLGRRSAVGSNLIVRRSVFEAVGGYPRDLGKLRGTLLTGEDHVLSLRVRDAGFHSVYDPSLVVHHLVPAERLRFGYFVRWFFWSGLTYAAIENAGRANSENRRAALYHLRQVFMNLAGAAGAALAANWSKAADWGTRAAFSAGYVWSFWKPANGPRTTPANGSREEAS